MRAFKCSSCGKVSFSSADLDRQTNPSCPYCGADKQHMSEVVLKNCDTCVCCGDYIPEGRMVCLQCEKDQHHVLKKRRDMNVYNKDSEQNLRN